MKDNGKNSFVIYHDIEKALNLLTDEQCGKLFKASVKYSSCGATPEFNDPTIDVAFAFIRNAIDRDTAVWEEKRQQRAKAGAKGGRQTAANRAKATFADREEANQAVPGPVLVPAPIPVSVPGPSPVPVPGPETDSVMDKKIA